MSIGVTWDDGDAAHQRGDLEEAIRIWYANVSENPTQPHGYLRIGGALRSAKRYAEAEQAYELGARMCGDRLGLLIGRAWVAHEQNHWPEALERWTELAKAAPNHGSGFVGMGRVLTRLGRYDEADAVLEAYSSRSPQDPDVLSTYAQTATARQDWPEALRRWDAFLRLRPDDEGGSSARGGVLWNMRMEREAPGAEDQNARRVPVEVGKVKDPEAHALLMEFESLGENCEFGLVQRRYEAEPLGLLRWTYTSPQTVARLLETRFEGLGEPENIVLERTEWHEYIYKDVKFGIHFHTFLTQTVSDEASFVKKQIARLRWLRERMLENLASGEKFFVFKAHHRGYEEFVEPIHAGLRRYGPNTLLWVGRATEHQPPGSAVAVGPGLVRGHLSVLNPAGPRWDIPFEEWLSICRQTKALVSARDEVSVGRAARA